MSNKIAQLGDENLSAHSSSQVPKSSARKRPVSSAHPSCATVFTQSVKKSKNIPKTLTPSVPAQSLTTMPYDVIAKLLLYLDVDTLEKLSATCSHFDQLIAGRFLPSIQLPLTEGFLAEMRNTSILEKKPLLKLRCNKAETGHGYGFGRPNQKDTIMRDFGHLSSAMGRGDYCKSVLAIVIKYLVSSQLAFLSIEQLREVDLVPGRLFDMGHDTGVVNWYGLFDVELMSQLESLGSLNNVTRLDLMVGETCNLAQFIRKMPNLLDLGLTVFTKSELSKKEFHNDYLHRLERAVAVSKAPVLRLTVGSESRSHPVNKVLKNSYVEKLVVNGPCTFNICPVMENLKEVVVELKNCHWGYGYSCSYLKCKEDDRRLHRHGLCCVNVGAVFRNCPKVERFMGIDIGSVSQNQGFDQWNEEVKKKFYQNYRDQGGDMKFNGWVRARWFSKRPEVLGQRAGVHPAFMYRGDWP